MPRTATTPARQRRTFLELQCPECTGTVRVARDEERRT